MAKNKDSQVSAVRKTKHGTALSVFFSLLSIVYVMPIMIVIINSFKRKAFINKFPFKIGTGKMFVGWENYVEGIRKIEFFKAFGYSLFITVCSVAVIILCTSMCAWYITRVQTKFTKLFYMLCLFSMIVPFQMVMFTLSKLANMLHLSNPIGIILVYLGFGAGLAVFMFTGFVKSIPLEIEEAAMIDGASKFQQIKYITVPLLKPVMIIMFITSIGGMFRGDLGLFYQLPKDSGALYPVTNVIDTYVYRGLMNLGDIGMSSAASLYQSFVGLILIVTSNAIVRKVDEENAFF